MRKATLVFLVFLSNVLLASCSLNDGRAEIYVLVPKAKEAKFTSDLVQIAQRYGLTTNVGHSVADHGHVFWVLEAKGHWQRLWSTNVPLSGYENPNRCGDYSEPHPDPGQYNVSVTPLPFFGSKQYAHDLLAELANDLKTSGYDIRSTSVECSLLSKLDSSRKTSN